MFEKATRKKYRFNSSKGMLTVEDLWDIPLTSNTDRPNLDTIARNLFLELKEQGDVSFVTPVKNNDALQDRFELVKHIIDIRLAERDARNLAAENAAKKQHLLGVIEAKENAALQDMPLDELKKMVEAL